MTDQPAKPKEPTPTPGYNTQTPPTQDEIMQTILKNTPPPQGPNVPTVPGLPELPNDQYSNIRNLGDWWVYPQDQVDWWQNQYQLRGTEIDPAWIEKQQAMDYEHQMSATDRSYWEDPNKIARWYLLDQNISKDIARPAWMDSDFLAGAYNYLATQPENEGKPWYEWQPIAMDDPIRAILRKQAQPLASEIPDWEKRAANLWSDLPDPLRSALADLTNTPELNPDWLQPVQEPTPEEQQQYLGQTTMGMPTDQWNQLDAGKQLEYLTLASPYAPAIQSTIIGTLQAATRTLIGSIGRSAVGEVISSTVTGGVKGGLGGMVFGLLMSVAGQVQPIDYALQNWFGVAPENLPHIEQKLLEVMNIPWNEVQKGLGDVFQDVSVIRHLIAGEDPQSIQVIKTILDGMTDREKQDPEAVLAHIRTYMEARHEASQLFYRSMGPLVGQGLWSQQIQTHEVGTTETHTITAPQGMTVAEYTLNEIAGDIYRKLNAGEPVGNVVEVYGPISSYVFGAQGLWNELYTQIYTDPTDLIPKAAASAVGVAADMTGSWARYAGLDTLYGFTTRVGAAYHGAEDVMAGRAEYKALVRKTPVSDIINSSYERWVAGIDELGVRKDMSVSAGTNPIARGWAWLTSATNEARAFEAIHTAYNAILPVLESLRHGDASDVDIMIRYMEMLGKITPEEAIRQAMAGEQITVKIPVGGEIVEAPVPRLFTSAELQPALMALKDQVQAAHDLASIYHSADAERAVIMDTADALKMDPYAIQKALVEGGAEAEAIIKQAIAAKVKGAETLSDTVKPFWDPKSKKPKIAFSPDEFQGELASLVATGVENWAVQRYGIKPQGWATRLNTLVKNAQGVLLFDYNPLYFMNNGLNNIITMAWDGILGSLRGRTRAKILERFGRPSFTEMGLTPAEYGSAYGGRDIFDDTKATKVEGLGEAIRSAREPETADMITNANRLVGQLRGKIGIFNRLSAWAEKRSSEMAVATALQQAMGRKWRPTDTPQFGGYRRIPAELRAKLEQIAPGLADQLERAPMRALNPKELEEAIFSKWSQRSARDVLSVDEWDAVNKFPDLVDSMEQRIAQATNLNEVNQAMDGFLQDLHQRVAEQIAGKVAERVEEITRDIAIDGTQAVLDRLDKLIRDRVEYTTRYQDAMGETADAANAAETDLEADRIWRDARRRWNQQWSLFDTEEAGEWMGIFQGLGINDLDPANNANTPYFQFMQGHSDLHILHRTFFVYRDTQMQAFFQFRRANIEKHRAQVADFWAETSKRINEAYIKMVTLEDSIQGAMDIAFADQFGAQFPGRRPEAILWRNSLRDVRRQQMLAEIYYRYGKIPDGLKTEWGVDLLPDLRDEIKLLTGNRPEWLVGGTERGELQRRFAEIRQRITRDMLIASNQHKPGSEPPTTGPEGTPGPEGTGPQAGPAGPTVHVDPNTGFRNDYDLSRKAWTAIIDTVTPDPEMMIAVGEALQAAGYEVYWYNDGRLIIPLDDRAHDAGITEVAKALKEQDIVVGDNVWTGDKFTFGSGPDLLNAETAAAHFKPLASSKYTNERRQLQNNYDRMRYTATHDGLTKLKNRRAWDGDDANGIGSEWQAAQIEAEMAGDPPPVAAFFDLRGLHLTNKDWGEAVGDAYIQAAAKAMLDAGVDGYRYGGDEFTAIFPDEATANAKMAEVMDRLENAVVIVNGDEYYGLKAHYGIGTDIETADAASNAAKNADPNAGIYQRSTYRLTRKAGEGEAGVAAPAEGMAPGQPAIGGSTLDLEEAKLAEADANRAAFLESLTEGHIFDDLTPAEREFRTGDVFQAAAIEIRGVLEGRPIVDYTTHERSTSNDKWYSDWYDEVERADKLRGKNKKAGHLKEKAEAAADAIINGTDAQYFKRSRDKQWAYEVYNRVERQIYKRAAELDLGPDQAGPDIAQLWRDGMHEQAYASRYEYDSTHTEKYDSPTHLGDDVDAFEEGYFEWLSKDDPAPGSSTADLDRLSEVMTDTDTVAITDKGEILEPADVSNLALEKAEWDSRQPEAIARRNEVRKKMHDAGYNYDDQHIINSFRHHLKMDIERIEQITPEMVDAWIKQKKFDNAEIQRQARDQADILHQQFEDLKAKYPGNDDATIIKELLHEFYPDPRLADAEWELFDWTTRNIAAEMGVPVDEIRAQYMIGLGDEGMPGLYLPQYESKLVARAKRIFVSPRHFEDTGFILPDGTTMDLHRAGTYGEWIDHWDAAKLILDPNASDVDPATGGIKDWLGEFMTRSAAIRVDPAQIAEYSPRETDTQFFFMQANQRPTRAQIAAIIDGVLTSPKDKIIIQYDFWDVQSIGDLETTKEHFAQDLQNLITRSYPQALYQTEGPNWYFSQLNKLIDEKLGRRFSADQLRGVIKNRITADELRWTEMDTFLEQHPGTILKDELREWLDDHNIRVIERWREESGKNIGMDGEALDEILFQDQRMRAWSDRMQQLVAEFDAAATEYNYETGTVGELGMMTAPDQPTLHGWVNDDGDIWDTGDLNRFLGDYPEGVAIIQLANQMEAYANQVYSENVSTKGAQASKWHKRFNVEGGTGYRELTLAWDTKSYGDWEAAARQYWNDTYRLNGNQPWEELDDYARGLLIEDAKNRGIGYPGNVHWEEPDVLVHVRFDVRKTIGGGRRLTILELQSDWHQDARNAGGYKTTYTLETHQLMTHIPELTENVSYFVANDPNKVGKYAIYRYDGERIASNQTMQEAMDAAEKYNGANYPVRLMMQYQSNRPGNTGALPYPALEVTVKAEDGTTLTLIAKTEQEAQQMAHNYFRMRPNPAPFSKNYDVLAIKRVIRYAAENGYDSVSFAGGPMAASVENHPLKYEVDTISYNPDTQDLIAWKDGSEVAHHSSITEEMLPDYIGYDATKQLKAMKVPTEDDFVITNTAFGGETNWPDLVLEWHNLIEERNDIYERLDTPEQRAHYIEAHPDRVQYAGDGPGDRRAILGWMIQDTQNPFYGADARRLQEIDAAMDGNRRIRERAHDGQWELYESGRLVGTFDSWDGAAERQGRMQQWQTLDTTGLVFGGEKMRWFYDRNLVNSVNKFIKKWGVKIFDEQVESKDAPRIWRAYDDVVGEHFVEGTSEAGVRAEAERITNQMKDEGLLLPEDTWHMEEFKGTFDIHTFEITDEMKRTALEEGFPLFQKTNGATWWDENGKVHIRLMENAYKYPNFSTWHEEFFHSIVPLLPERHIRTFERYLREEYGIENLPAGWEKGQRQHAFVEINGEKVGEKEILARADLRYFREGKWKGLSQAVADVFEAIKNYMRKAYYRVKGSAIDVKLPDYLKQAFEEIHRKPDEAGAMPEDPGGPSPAEDAYASAKVREGSRYEADLTTQEQIIASLKSIEEEQTARRANILEMQQALDENSIKPNKIEQTKKDIASQTEIYEGTWSETEQAFDAATVETVRKRVENATAQLFDEYAGWNLIQQDAGPDPHQTPPEAMPPSLFETPPEGIRPKPADAGEPGPLLQLAGPSDWYFYQLQEILDAKMGRRATVAQVENMVKGSVKPDELDWSGFHTYIETVMEMALDENPNATKQNTFINKVDLFEFLGESSVKIGEDVHGGYDFLQEHSEIAEHIKTIPEVEHFLEQWPEWHIVLNPEEPLTVRFRPPATDPNNPEMLHSHYLSQYDQRLGFEAGAAQTAIENYLKTVISKNPNFNQWAEYTVKGGQNYHEMTIQWITDPLTNIERKAMEAWANHRIWEEHHSSENVPNQWDLIPDNVKFDGRPFYSMADVYSDWDHVSTIDPHVKTIWRSQAIRQSALWVNEAHWDGDPNVIVHVRWDTRLHEKDGGKILNIMEVQSDLHQAARQFGYRQPYTIRDDGPIMRRGGTKYVKYTMLPDPDQPEKYIVYNQWGAEIGTSKTEAAATRRMQRYDRAQEPITEWDSKNYKIAHKYTIVMEDGTEPYSWVTMPIRDHLKQLDATVASWVDDLPVRAPFQKYDELAIKRMIRWAAENDFKYVAIPSGETAAIAEHHRMQPGVDMVTYNPTSQELTGYRNGTQEISADNVEPERLWLYVGKKVARQIDQAEVAKSADIEVVPLHPEWTKWNVKQAMEKVSEWNDKRQFLINQMANRADFLEYYKEHNPAYVDMLNRADGYESYSMWRLRTDDMASSYMGRPWESWIKRYKQMGRNRDRWADIYGMLKDQRYIVNHKGVEIGRFETLRVANAFASRHLTNKIATIPIGEEITFGAEKMRGFYDARFPNTVNKYIKKWGARLEDSVIGTGEVDYSTVRNLTHDYNYDTGMWEVTDHPNGMDEGGPVVYQALTAVGAENYIRRMGEGKTPVYIFEVTPEMKASVMRQRQPLFQTQHTRSFKDLRDVPSPLSGYVGNKRTMLQAGAYDGIVTDQTANAVTKIVDAFGGSGLLGNAFQQKMGINRVLNELDPEIHNFHVQIQQHLTEVLDVIRNQEMQIMRIFETHPEGGGEAYDLTQAFWRQMSKNLAEGTPAERAALVAMANNGAISAIGGGGQKLISGAGTKKGTYAWHLTEKTFGNLRDSLTAHNKLLQNADITKADARQWLKDAGPNDLVLLDPPYVQRSETETQVTSYAVGQDLSSLPGALAFIRTDIAEANGRGVPIIYTNNAHPEIIAALTELGFHTRIQRVRSANRGGKASERTEVIAWNDYAGSPGTDRNRSSAERAVRESQPGQPVDLANGARSQEIPAGNASAGELPVPPESAGAGPTAGIPPVQYGILGEPAAAGGAAPAAGGTAPAAGGAAPPTVPPGGGPPPTTATAGPEPTGADGPPAYNAPLGTSDSLKPMPVDASAMLGVLSEIEPVIAKAKQRMRSQRNVANSILSLERSVPKEIMDQVRTWAGGVRSDLVDTKYQATQFAKYKRDQALLDYTKRTGFDNLLGVIFPYSFWYTHSAVNWALRALTRPTIIANFLRLRNLQRQNMENRDGFPTRLLNKLQIPAPFLPAWMGNSIYIDPMRQIYPFMQMLQPFAIQGQQENQLEKRAISNIQYMAQNEQIGQDAAQAAITTKSGPIWEKAYEQAKAENDTQEMVNPAAPWQPSGGRDFFDLAFSLMSPSLPVSFVYNQMTGREMGKLPITRFIQNVTQPLGIGGPRGFMITRDRFDDYRVDRALVTMAGDGTISGDQAVQAMVERKGDIFNQAQQRAGQWQGMQYWMGALAGDLFPEGERETRALQDDYKRALERKLTGVDAQAMNKFYDDHPEYEARQQSFEDPEGRLRQLLISQIWNGYMAMNSLNKKQAQNTLGRVFQENFVNKDTRNYDGIDTNTLLYWSRLMGSTTNPSAEQLPSLANQILPQGQQLSTVDATTSQAYDEYSQAKDANFPGVDQIYDLYYMANPYVQNKIKEQHPELDQYQRWKTQYLANNPSLIPYMVSPTSDLATAPPQVQQFVYQYWAARDLRYPNYREQQSAYFALTDPSQRKAYLKAHPELQDYWDWRPQIAAQMPQAAPWIFSAETLAQMITGERYGTSYGGTASGSSINISRLGMTEDIRRTILEHAASNTRLSLGIESEVNDMMARAKVGGTPEAFLKSILPALKAQEHPPVLSKDEIAQIPPELTRALAIYKYSGTPLGSGATATIEQLQKEWGITEALDVFVSQYLLPAITNPAPAY